MSILLQFGNKLCARKRERFWIHGLIFSRSISVPLSSGAGVASFVSSPLVLSFGCPLIYVLIIHTHI